MSCPCPPNAFSNGGRCSPNPGPIHPGPAARALRQQPIPPSTLPQSPNPTALSIHPSSSFSLRLHNQLPRSDVCSCRYSYLVFVFGHQLSQRLHGARNFPRNIAVHLGQQILFILREPARRSRLLLLGQLVLPPQSLPTPAADAARRLLPETPPATSTHPSAHPTASRQLLLPHNPSPPSAAGSTPPRSRHERST